jgi:hypothetical protein
MLGRLDDLLTFAPGLGGAATANGAAVLQGQFDDAEDEEGEGLEGVEEGEEDVPQ